MSPLTLPGKSGGKQEEGNWIVHHLPGEHHQCYVLIDNLSGGLNSYPGLDLIDPQSSFNL